MKYYHYAPMSALQPIKRLGRNYGWEFIESPQDQSEGKPTACYLTTLSPEDLAKNDKPVARVLGLKATSGDYWLCFEMDLPNEWEKAGSAVRVSPISGDRGKKGIALYMVKQKDYAKSLDADVEARTDYIYINSSYCTGIRKISTATGKDKSIVAL
ncbi:hypothetical protein [Xanthomonas euvesicatoria]|uniref:hypothetical protein n=1 Tax=Xanthomonas euvesicatoria TaxID=456327 RepID=UPI001C43DF91|nr:hypothetical protein [Xanthomonas euvesicatoria]MBV6850782.1 hypothetical protein [Xanthomonas campestris pv. heliotropii]